MTLSELRSQQKRGRLPILEVFSGVLLIIGAIVFGTNLVSYSDSVDDLGSDVTIGGVQVGGLDTGARLARLEAVYVEQPIVMRYQGSPILLNPREVGFQLDTDAMQAAAERQSGADDDFWTGFWNYLWNRPQPAIDVPLSATLSEAELGQYLQDLSNRYDRDAGSALFDSTNLTFQGSSGNSRLDQQQAAALIRQALYESDPSKRVIELPITTTPGQGPTMQTLQQSVLEYVERTRGVFINGQNTVVSLYVMNLETGEEMGIQPNVQHVATSTIKIGILINYFRHQITAPPDEVKLKLAEAVICSSNAAANDIMLYTSESGSIIGGLQNNSATLCEAGAVNSGLNSNLYIGPLETLNVPNYYDQIFPTPCPGSSVASAQIETINANAGNQNFTTAADMGTLLMMIYDCAYNGSGLLTVFPEEITQTECRQMLELLDGTEFKRLMELGVPEGVQISHKVGYANETVGDAGIVFSPNGDYIFVIYVWERDADGDNLTKLDKWDLIADVSRIVYNYFNPNEPLMQTRLPPNPNGGVECVVPRNGIEVNLEDIDQGRFDVNGDPLPSACYGWDNGQCKTFEGWTP